MAAMGKKLAVAHWQWQWTGCGIDQCCWRSEDCQIWWYKGTMFRFPERQRRKPVCSLVVKDPERELVRIG